MDRLIVKTHFLSHLTNAEHYDTMEAVLAVARPYVDAFPMLKDVWAELEDAFDKEKAMWKITRKMEATAQLKELDRQRTQSIRRIRKTIAFYRGSPVAAEQQAARSLRSIVRHYRTATYQPYMMDSAMIRAFLDVLDEETNAESIARLGLRPLIEQAEAENEAFHTLFWERAREMGVLQDAKLRPARRATDLALSAVAHAANSLCTTCAMTAPESEPFATLRTLILKANAQLSKAEDIYRRRLAAR